MKTEIQTPVINRFSSSLNDENLPEGRNSLALSLRVTNGAGLQTIVNSNLEIPGSDISPPSEPVVSLEHSGFYGPEAPNQLRIITSGSQDLESGITAIEYRILDGKSGSEISGWEDFVFLDPNSPTFVLPANEKVVQLPDFPSSRTIIVETRATNGAGLQSNRGIRFIELDLDDTAPSEPQLTLKYGSRSPWRPFSGVAP